MRLTTRGWVVATAIATALYIGALVLLSHLTNIPL